MYFLSRWLLQLSVIINAYTLFIMAVLGWPWSGVFAAGLVLAAFTRLKGRQLTTLGSAKFADEDDLCRAGMLSGSTGLILGRIPVKSKPLTAIWSLFQRRIKAKHACGQLLELFTRKRGKVVRANKAIHTAVFAPTGVGKGVSCILPFLYQCPESCVVVDFKGENAKLSASAAAKSSVTVWYC